MAKTDPKAWKPPNGNFDEGNIAAFVQKHYGKNASIANNVYNRLRKKGAAFVQNSDGSYTRARPEEIKQAPVGWGQEGAVNLRNGFEAQGLDTSVWETGKNAAGRWFARKPTLEQKLLPYERDTLRQFDAKAAAAPTYMSTAYDQYAAAANEVAANTRTMSDALNRAQGTSSASAAEGVVNPNAGAQAASTAQTQAAAATTPIANYYTNMPATVAAARANALGTLAGQQQTARSSLMSSLQEAVYARQKAEADRKAQLRAAELQFLGEKAGLESRERIAAADNQTRINTAQIGAGATLGAATVRAGADGGKTTDTAKAYGKWSDSLAGVLTGKEVPAYDTVNGKQVKRLNPDGSQATVTQPVNSNVVVRAIRQGFSKGYNAAQVWNAITPYLEQSDFMNAPKNQTNAYRSAISEPFFNFFLRKHKGNVEKARKNFQQMLGWMPPVQQGPPSP
jgi:hypothetical protein